jgi:hypothetical protein
MLADNMNERSYFSNTELKVNYRNELYNAPYITHFTLILRRQITLCTAFAQRSKRSASVMND